MRQPYHTYKQTEVSTATPMKLVLMLYDGAISFLARSLEYGEAGDVRNRNLSANKARAIIEELNHSLNIEVGGELAGHLRRLYLFMNRHLLQATMGNQTAGIREVIDLLTTLREGWQDAYRQTSMSAAASYGQPAGNPYRQAGVRV
jgi:flagellar secretion chaperone FliS